jgi:hypothetical protein
MLGLFFDLFASHPFRKEREVCGAAAASEEIRGFFAALRMTTIVGLRSE